MCRSAGFARQRKLSFCGASMKIFFANIATFAALVFSLAAWGDWNDPHVAAVVVGGE